LILSFDAIKSGLFSVEFKNIGANDLQLQEVGDFGDENCLPPQKLATKHKASFNH